MKLRPRQSGLFINYKVNAALEINNVNMGYRIPSISGSAFDPLYQRSVLFRVSARTNNDECQLTAHTVLR